MEQLISLHDLLQHEIEDLYSAEEQIIAALPKMIEMASHEQLKKALNDHLQVTKQQKQRLDKVKQLLEKELGNGNSKPGLMERLFGAGTKCKGIEGLVKEGEKLMKESMEDSVRDAAIIASAQKIEHYEISGYGTARAYAMQLGLSAVENLLNDTLKEEFDTDNQLSALAMFDVNLRAEEAQSVGNGSGR